MAYKPPGAYVYKSPPIYKPPPPVYKPPQPPKQIIAEVNDDFESLSKKLGIETQDLIKANVGDTGIKAGAVYNVPPPKPKAEQADFIKADATLSTADALKASNAAYGVSQYDPAVDGDYQKWLAEQSGATQPAPIEKPNAFKDAWDWLGNLGDGQAAWDWIDWGKNKETGYLPPGVGVGAGIGPGFQPPPSTLPQTQAEFADFKQAEAQASYRDLEAQRMTGTLGITDITDKPGYYGNYGTEQDIGSDFTDIYNPAYNPNPNLGATLDVGDVPVGGLVETNASALQNMWEDVYLDPDNKGRGGGIVGWIEERTGLTIDPETFFTEGASEEVLAKMLAEFRPDELNYLESQGILVPEEGYALGGGRGGGNYSYPAISYRSGGGSYGSGPSRPYPRQSNLGLVSWSI